MSTDTHTPTAAEIIEWARQTVTGFDPDLGLRDQVAATTAPASAREAVIDVAHIAIEWEQHFAREAAS